jgi:hypothetical protein
MKKIGVMCFVIALGLIPSASIWARNGVAMQVEVSAQGAQVESILVVVLVQDVWVENTSVPVPAEGNLVGGIQAAALPDIRLEIIMVVATTSVAVSAIIVAVA